MPQPPSGFLAKRAGKAIAPALPYFAAFNKAKENLWSLDNPDGSIVLAVAENRLTSDLIEDALHNLAQQERLPTDLLTYNDFRGMPALRQQVARLLESTFMEGLTINPAHLSVLCGAGTVIDVLFHCIAEPGDAVLIPAPYYPAFDNDLQVRNQVLPVPVYLDLNPDSGSLEAQLDAASNEAHREGHNVRALLLSHPSNPLGTVYDRDQLTALLRWCLKRRVHCVSDEIYANSVFATDAAGLPFTSLAQLAHSDHPRALPGLSTFGDELIHVIFGFSKDFCASGLRLGCLWSRNDSLNAAIGNLSYFAGVSTHTQWLLARLLGDEQLLHGFLRENRRRLARSYATLAAALDAVGVSYVPAVAAMFLWVDLRRALPAPSWEGERTLWDEMVDKYGVLLTPGESCHAREPGFFRICWAWMPHDSLPVAVQRIAKMLADKAPLPAAAS